MLLDMNNVKANSVYNYRFPNIQSYSGKYSFRFCSKISLKNGLWLNKRTLIEIEKLCLIYLLLSFP